MGSTPRDAPCTPSRRPTRTHDAREENHKRCGVRIILLYHHNVRPLTIHGRSLPLTSLICPAPTCLVCLACATSTAVPACRREIINDKRMNGGRRGRATPTPSCHLAPVNEARHTPRAHWTTLVATRFHNYDFDFIAAHASRQGLRCASTRACHCNVPQGSTNFAPVQRYTLPVACMRCKGTAPVVARPVARPS